MEQNNKEGPPTFVFDGFEPANTTPVPDVLFDVLLPHLSGAELKVLLYIIRRTWGFKKDCDAISFKQFLKGIVTKDGKVLDYGCGISNRTVLSKALADLEAKGLIKTTKGKDPSGDNAVSLYSIRFKGTGVVPKPYHPSQQGSTETVPPVVSKPYHGSNQSVPGVVSKPYPQETVLQSNSLQETDSQEGTYRAGEGDTPQARANAPTPTLVSHPEHSFLWFDDGLAPTMMVLRFTPSFPHPYFSEVEDKRRGHIAEEVLHHLKQRGLKIALRSEHETANEAAIVESRSEYRPDFMADRPTTSSENDYHSHRIANDTPAQAKGEEHGPNALPGDSRQRQQSLDHRTDGGDSQAKAHDRGTAKADQSPAHRTTSAEVPAGDARTQQTGGVIHELETDHHAHPVVAGLRHALDEHPQTHPGNAGGVAHDRSVDSPDLLPGHDRRDLPGGRVQGDRDTGPAQPHTNITEPPETGRDTPAVIPQEMVYTNSLNDDGTVYSAGAPSSQPRQAETGGARGYTQAEQLATLTAGQQPRGARIEKGSGRRQGRKAAEYKVYFSVEGAAFRAWYEELTGVVLDETAANARACNTLSQRASVTYENTKIVIHEIRTSKWVKRERVAVTVQDLASDNKTLRWEKWLIPSQMDASSPTASSKPDQGKGYTLAVNDPAYNIDDDFYNNREAWAAFDAPPKPKGAPAHV